MTADAIEVLHEDAWLVVVNKPAGMLSVPSPGAAGRTVLDALRARGIEAHAVHRLDRDASGAIVFAKDAATAQALEALFRARSVDKTYWALIQGRPPRNAGTFSFRILDAGSFARVSPAGKPAVTHWKVLERHARATEVEVDLETGRYNQIRLHFAHAGFPLVGERKYARGRDDPLKAKRVALHAARIAFPHPHGGAKLAVTAPLPGDLARLRAAAAGRGD